MSLQTFVSARKKTIILITNDVDEAILLADRIIPLNPGPNATLGPHFKVDIERPRDRTAMNNDEQFIKLRAAVTDYLIDVGAEAQEGDELITLPDIEPVRLGKQEALPKAYAEMSTSGREERYLEFSELKKSLSNA